MKDLSLFLLKNSVASKMKRGIRSFCNGVGSTSTLNQTKADCDVSCIAAPSIVSSCMEESNEMRSSLTLEEMILQLELEEEAARRAKLDEYGELLHRRMSCVNNSDILRSARSALNQYPRFSLDGRDAMYQSSFRNFGAMTSGFEGRRKSVCCSSACRGLPSNGYEVDLERSLRLPPTLAGESVVWCKPSVVAKLMGLDAVPVPVSGRHGKKGLNPLFSRKQSLRRMAKHELEKERLFMGTNGWKGRTRRKPIGSCSATVNPISVEPASGREDWRFMRAR
ncbi:uncharacterized protein [Elaeis guineensis]|uniref:Uncharacterized protein LOC109506626 n=1 Tax=Elaeis guineensis var. tenera TaxID=51953 RepID=A0A6J0PR99_ELAGV|nr:uncharacterized protein LOC109506626 [Elaeis guineensis]